MKIYATARIKHSSLSNTQIDCWHATQLNLFDVSSRLEQEVSYPS